MILQEKQQRSSRLKRHKKKKLLWRIAFLLICCFIFFSLGRYFVMAVEALSKNEKAVTVANQSNEDYIEDLDHSENNSDADEEKLEFSEQDKWNLILVNKTNSLPQNFDVNLTQLKNGHSVDERIYSELQKMLDDARSEGLSPILCSSFRTFEKQQTLFQNQVQKYISRGYAEYEAKIESAKWIAIPGTSEHQTGLAVDIVSAQNQVLNSEQEKTPEQQWLIKNSYKYGFILRYPSDKSHITGIGYEPWHYRYVGKEAAKEIMEKGICLEEYLN